jgi:hypothetical protein
MKNLYIALITVLIVGNLKAQSPEKISYQAVVRDASNALITNQNVGVQVSILQGSTSGTAVYVETQVPTSNINGLVSLEIGSGTVVSGTFSSIDWSNGPYFIKNEIDPTGGTTYTISGVSQLMSVPYALHATSADNVINDQVNDADADSTNELISTVNLSGDTLYVMEAGSTSSVDLSSLKANFGMTTKDAYTTSTSVQYLATFDFVDIYTNSNYGDLVVGCPAASTKPIILTAEVGTTQNTYVLFPGDSQIVSSGTSATYVKLLVHRFSSLYTNAKSLLFEGHNMGTGYISGMMFYRDF